MTRGSVVGLKIVCVKGYCGEKSRSGEVFMKYFLLEDGKTYIRVREYSIPSPSYGVYGVQPISGVTIICDELMWNEIMGDNTKYPVVEDYLAE